MKNSIKIVFRASVLAAIAAVVPATSFAATSLLETTVTKTYATTFTKQYGQAFPFTGGKLRLTLTKDGYIQGYFTPADSVSFVPVTGGRDGAKVWFDIGGARSTYVTGTLEGNEIVGYATAPDGVQYRFTAVPQEQTD